MELHDLGSIDAFKNIVFQEADNVKYEGLAIIDNALLILTNRQYTPKKENNAFYKAQLVTQKQIAKDIKSLERLKAKIQKAPVRNAADAQKLKRAVLIGTEFAKHLDQRLENSQKHYTAEVSLFQDHIVVLKDKIYHFVKATFQHPLRDVKNVASQALKLANLGEKDINHFQKAVDKLSGVAPRPQSKAPDGRVEDQESGVDKGDLVAQEAPVPPESAHDVTAQEVSIAPEVQAASAVAASSLLNDVTLQQHNAGIVAQRVAIRELTGELENIERIVQRGGYTDQLRTRESEIREIKARLNEQHDAAMTAKFEYVKATYPTDMAYAMAIPKTLSKGDMYYTSGTSAKMKGLFSSGILFDMSRAATGVGPNAVMGSWGINEMGDRGVYFSVGKPEYMGPQLPEAIGCMLVNDLPCASIPPVSVLRLRYHIPDDQIDSAYDRLQQEFPVIQHDGTYPSDTEVVFMRNVNDLILRDYVKASPDGDPIQQRLPAVVHESWLSRPMAAGHTLSEVPPIVPPPLTPVT